MDHQQQSEAVRDEGEQQEHATADELLDAILAHTGGRLWDRAKWVKRLAELLKAEAQLARVRRDTLQIDNGNPFVFCDWVGSKGGCVRGAGHNGPHIEWTDAHIHVSGPLMARTDEQEPQR